MKKIIIPIFLFLFFISCEKEEYLDPRPDLVGGQYIRLNILNESIDFNKISSSEFQGVLTNPAKDVVKYELFIRRRSADGQNTSDFVVFKTITSFPHDLNINAQNISTALNVNVSDLKDGDIYRFIGYSYNAQGVKSGFLNLSRVVQSTASLKQGYKFSVNLSSTIDPENPFNNYAPFSI